MNKITITLQQLDSDNYKVLALVNTAQLDIGQTVERERVLRWTTLKNVTVRIQGSDSAEQTPDLLSDAPKQKRAPKSKQLADGQQVLSIAK